MTQFGIASKDNPPAGSTNVTYTVNVNEQQDQHGPCNAWHYMGPNNDRMLKLFGHVNEDRQKFIDTAKEKLTKINVPSCIKVGGTGYWDKVSEIKTQRFCQTTDETGRDMFFLGDWVIMSRYLHGDTLIYYSREGRWENKLAYKENIREWNKILGEL